MTFTSKSWIRSSTKAPGTVTPLVPFTFALGNLGLTGNRTLLRTIASFRLYGYAIGAPDTVDTQWASGLDTAVMFYIAQSPGGPTPAQVDPWTGSSPLWEPIGTAMLVPNNFYVSSNNSNSFADWRLQGGEIDSKAQRKLTVNERVYVSVHSRDANTLIGTSDGVTAYPWGWSAIVNSLVGVH